VYIHGNRNRDPFIIRHFPVESPAENEKLIHEKIKPNISNEMHVFSESG
jgi:hypothetical protein